MSKGTPSTSHASYSSGKVNPQPDAQTQVPIDLLYNMLGISSLANAASAIQWLKTQQSPECLAPSDQTIPPSPGTMS